MRKGKLQITCSKVCNWEARRRVDSSHCSLNISEVEMGVTPSAGPVRKGNRNWSFPNFLMLMVWKASLAGARRKWWDGPGDLFGLWEGEGWELQDDSHCWKQGPGPQGPSGWSSTAIFNLCTCSGTALAVMLLIWWWGTFRKAEKQSWKFVRKDKESRGLRSIAESWHYPFKQSFTFSK